MQKRRGEGGIFPVSLEEKRDGRTPLIFMSTIFILVPTDCRSSRRLKREFNDGFFGVFFIGDGAKENYVVCFLGDLFLLSSAQGVISDGVIYCLICMATGLIFIEEENRSFSSSFSKAQYIGVAQRVALHCPKQVSFFGLQVALPPCFRKEAIEGRVVGKSLL